MNVRMGPFEARQERSRIFFGGFGLSKHVEEPWALALGAPLWDRILRAKKVIMIQLINSIAPLLPFRFISA
jgi:hypothetical protein